MIIEIFMLVTAATIFIIIARRFPATAQEGEGSANARLGKPESFWGSNLPVKRSWLPRINVRGSFVRQLQVGLFFKRISRTFMALARSVKFPRFRPRQQYPPIIDQTKAMPDEMLRARSRSTSQDDSSPIEQASPFDSDESTLAKADEWFARQDFVKAENYYLKAALQFPKEVKIYSRLGVIYLDRKNYRDAKEALVTAVKLDPDIPSRHYNLALAYAGQNDRKNALRSIQAALSLDPKNGKYRKLMEKLAG